MWYWPSFLARIGQPQPADARDDDIVQAQDLLRTWAADAALVDQAKQEGFQAYDVFLSHAGEQKWDVIATLRERFPWYSLAFTDAWDLQHGESSVDKMVVACGTATIGIVVISKEFVAKAWPMRELHILVDRHCRGEVGLVPLLWFDRFEDFEAIVDSYQQCCDHRRLWAEDLKYLDKTCMVVKGMLTARRALPEVAQEVVDAALRLLRQAPGSGSSAGAGQRPVGFDDQLAGLVEVMRPGSAGQPGKAVWLHGPGGVGKTKMATQLQRDLEALGFVRQAAVLSLEFTAGSGPALSEEQATQLLKGAVHDLTGRNCTAATPAEVRKWFAEAATRPATLLVVDNVHSQEQIGLLLREPLCLDRVPFVIFTSRLQQPIGGSRYACVWTQVYGRLRQHGVHTLSAESALRLFRKNCQRPTSVPQGLEERVVAACGGLPLALLILAGILVGQDDVASWTAAAQAMVEGGDPARDVLAESEFGLQRMMQHSLLGLAPEAVSMFLDTACVLVGQDERDALAVWQVWHGSSRAAAVLRQLKNRNLLSVDVEGKLWVHDVLRWYGRRVVRGEAELDGQCEHRGSRLWVHDGSVQPQVSGGRNCCVVTAQLDQPVAPSFGKHSVEDPSPAPGLGLLDRTRITAGTKILLAGRHRVAVPPQGLLWLEVRGRAFPELDSVIAGNSQLCILQVEDVEGLQALPESLGQLSSLQKLSLWRCSGLTELPKSVGQLSALQELYLGGCHWLTELPASVGQLSSLQELVLWGCSGLAELPASVGQLSSLQQLHLQGCSRLTELPASVGQLSSLQMLTLERCSGLTQLPASVGQLSLLQKLDLELSWGLTELSASVGQLLSLQELNLEECCGLTALPASVGQLSSLQLLNLKGCYRLTKLPASVGQLSSLQKLCLRGCSGLTKLPASVGQLSSLQHLNLGYCSGLIELPASVGQLSSLQYLTLCGCSGLTALPASVGQLSSLQKLNLDDCSGLTELPASVGQLSSLQGLDLRYCSGLTELPASVGQLSSLQGLCLTRCSGLTELPASVGQLSSLLWLDLMYCSRLTELPASVGQLSSLQLLNLYTCSGLTELPASVGQLSSLQELDLYNCSGLTELPAPVGELSSLRQLDLRYCRGLTELPAPVGQLSALQVLKIDGCSLLTGRPASVRQLSSLQQLHLGFCSGLTELPAFVGQLSSLQVLDLRDCSGLTELPASVWQLSSLKVLKR